MLLKLLTTILLFGWCSEALRAYNGAPSHRNLPPKQPIIRPTEGRLLEGIRGGTAEESRPEDDTTGNDTKFTSSDVLAAYYEGEGEFNDLEALEAFLKEAQLALLHGHKVDYITKNPGWMVEPHSKDLSLEELKDMKNFVVRCQIRVKFAPTLQDFLASRTEANAFESEDGIVTISALIHAFVEPNWQRVEHVSSGGTPLVFVRDPHDDESHHSGEGTEASPAEKSLAEASNPEPIWFEDEDDDEVTSPAETSPAETSPAETSPAETSPAETSSVEDSPAETSPAETSPLLLERALEQALRDAPTIALKLIRREAIEELRQDCLQKSGRVSPNDENTNNLNGSDESTNNNNSPKQSSTGPGSGDADAAKIVNELAMAWNFRRQNGPWSTVLADFSIAYQDDCVLSTKDATTRFVQSRVLVKVKETKNDNKRDPNRPRLELILQSPSLATPISGVRPRGTGCTFCKVINPLSIAPALAAAGCKILVRVRNRTGLEMKLHATALR